MKSIEAQHELLVERARRIYSFSPLTFQEYFTARAIVAGAPLSLQQLVGHLQQRVEQYGNANKLLVECLNSNCPLTPAVRQEIEGRLLLPVGGL